MVVMPVRLYKAARRERAKFHRVYRTERPVHHEEPFTASPQRPHLVRKAGVNTVEIAAPPPQPAAQDDYSEPEPGPVARVHTQQVSGEDEDAVLEPSQILKGYRLEDDRFAVFNPAELAALRPRTSTELEILEFVRLDEIDPIFFDTSYYIAPNRGGEKPYAVLYRALKESGYVALGTLAMHGREHATVIRPGHSGLLLHTMFYENEVRSSEEYRTGEQLVTGKELELAKLLIEATAAPFEPAKLKDKYEERVQALIASRAAVAAPLQPGPEKAITAPVPDVMEALRRSLEAVRKPVKSESRGRGDKNKHRVRHRKG